MIITKKPSFSLQAYYTYFIIEIIEEKMLVKKGTFIMKLLKNLSLIATILCLNNIATMHGMNNTLSLGGPGGPVVGGRTSKTPYEIWLEQGADVRKLSPEEVLVFSSQALVYYNEYQTEQEKIATFTQLLSTLPPQAYNDVFNQDEIDDVIHWIPVWIPHPKEGKLCQSCIAKLKLLIHAAIKNNDMLILERIQKGFDTAQKAQIEEIQTYLDYPPFAQDNQIALNNLHEAHKIITETMVQAQREQRLKEKIFMTRPKGDTTFGFE